MTDHLPRWLWAHPGWVALIVCAPAVAVVVGLVTGL